MGDMPPAIWVAVDDDPLRLNLVRDALGQALSERRRDVNAHVG